MKKQRVLRYGFGNAKIKMLLLTSESCFMICFSWPILRRLRVFMRLMGVTPSKHTLDSSAYYGSLGVKSVSLTSDTSAMVF